VLRPFNFWLMMGCATTLLSFFAILFGRPLFNKGDLCLKNILIGVASAILLYGIFWIGNQMLAMILSTRAEHLGAIYANKGSLSPMIVGALLFFPIGFGEELFWRGYVQRQFTMKYGKLVGLALATSIYVLVHLATGNPVLLLAALFCGLFWGGLYLWTGSLTTVIVSHMIWDPLIFVVWPVV
jgi:uncharacterized protein